MRIFVGNLPWRYSSNDLTRLFESYGTVVSAEVVSDALTGHSRGFGFVEMNGREAALAAIDGLDGCDCDGRQVTVYRARRARIGH
ncbi:MAG: RNA recognition motif domain-containing protein [Acidimicrobiia bacterium]